MCDVFVSLWLCGEKIALPSVIHPIGEPVAGMAVAEDAVETAAGELDIPVVALGGVFVPPAVLEGPRTGGDAHETLDAGGGAWLRCHGDQAQSRQSTVDS